jgi:hypothetical protein
MLGREQWGGRLLLRSELQTIIIILLIILIIVTNTAHFVFRDKRVFVILQWLLVIRGEH